MGNLRKSSRIFNRSDIATGHMRRREEQRARYAEVSGDAGSCLGQASVPILGAVYATGTPAPESQRRMVCTSYLGDSAAGTPKWRGSSIFRRAHCKSKKRITEIAKKQDALRK